MPSAAYFSRQLPDAPAYAPPGPNGQGWHGATGQKPATPDPNDPSAAWNATAGPTGSYKRANRTTRHDFKTGPAPDTSPYGTESGPGILESWFNQRANGTDPAYEYAMNRGGDAIDTRMAAGGSFNSGARGQQLSDFAANMAAQRMGQLDTLAGGASGEHMGRLGMMFNQGLGIANGLSGAGTAYDLGAAGNMSAAAQAQQQMALNKAGVDAKANAGLANTVLNAYAISQSGRGGGMGGGGNPYDPNALMPPSY